MTLGWLGNAVLLFALIGLSNKNRHAWILSFAGNFIWCIYAIHLSMWDILAVDGFCALVAIRSWFAWRE
jgi:hypothetical protein